MLRKLEKYEIGEEIGHGGMATVYRARDTHLDREVAVKVMHPHLRAAAEARQRFTREARTVAKLKHGNILEIYDYSGEDSPESYIATELLTGPTLKLFAEKHPDMPPEIAACFTIEIARALAVAHANGIIHRDVKPENVLLHENRAVKLTDFGIAQMVDAQSMTATGQVLGSPGHMAPEQVEGKDCEAPADLFSLGTVLYFLATGRLPFTGKNPHQILKKIVDGEYVDPIRVRPTIGGRLRTIIRRLLEREPANRYQTARELEKDLAGFLSEMGIDDASAQLVAYLKDPETTSRALRETAVDRCAELGEKALEVGDLPTAQDHFNRVLALDETNARVLALLARMGRRARRRTVYLVACAVIGVVGIGLGVAALAWPDDPDNHHGTRPPHVATDAGLVDAGVLPAHDAGARASVDTGVPPDTGLHGVTQIAVHVPQSGNRLVVYAPSPEAVRIGVDGADPRSFGPSYNRDLLTVGRHHFVVVGEADFEGGGVARPYAPGTFDETIPSGDGPYRLRLALAYRPAHLYVASNVMPADVAVDGRPVGRARDPSLTIPMDRIRRTVTITVTAPGHRAYTTAWTLEAGAGLSEIPATLEPEGAGGAP